MNTVQAPGVIGDFASRNPRHTYIAGPGGLVAGPNGCLVGHFAWATAPEDSDGTPATVSNSGFGPVSGFVHREQQGLIVDYLASSGLKVQKGFGVTLHTSGDFWAKNDGATEAEFGMKAYANVVDGSVSFAATGSPSGGGTSTASTIAAKTASFTGAIADDVLTVTAASGDPIVAGALIAVGAGVAPNTRIVQQLSGTAGGNGTYEVSIPEQTVAAESMTATYGLLTIGGTVAGTFGLNQPVSGSGVSAGTFITQLGTGTGGAGTYFVNNTQTVGSGAINSAGNVETKWFAASTGLPSEVVKISDQPLG